MIKVSVIGATGYAGAELIRLLLSHSKVELKNLSSKSFVGKNINEVYPNLNKNLDKLLLDENKIFEDTDVVFASLPAGLSDDIANKCFEKNILFIDLGADFRLVLILDWTMKKIIKIGMVKNINTKIFIKRQYTQYLK